MDLLSADILVILLVLNNLICLYQLVTSFLLFILAGMYLMLEYLNFSSIIKFDIPTKL